MGKLNWPGLLGGAAIAALLGGMAITNPNQTAYERYATAKLSEYLNNEVCSEMPTGIPEEVPAGLTDFLKKQCQDLVKTNQVPLQEVIHRSTQRQNFLIFSLYHTRLSVPGMAGLPTWEVDTLGIFNQFLIYRAAQK